MITYPNMRVDEHLHGSLHVLLELGMKSIQRAVYGDCRILFVNVIKQHSKTLDSKRDKRRVLI